MNRTDRLYALVEELRAAGPRGMSASRLAQRFEVSVRTVERDLSALAQAGVPLSAQPGRRGGYVLDRSMTLPPLNFTPGEAAAVAVALSRSDRVPWAGDARSALRKIVAAMPLASARQAQQLADRVRLLIQPAPEPDPAVAETVWRAVYERRRL
ncbi:MAG: HTH domain-containing protein, partial [Micromonosporaceae bacterium]|nr:HTH domain-containing protein [Micromonosporaceae bacterium]